MRAYRMLRRRGEFSRVTKRGSRRAGSYLTCFVVEGRRETRVGITVTAAIGCAVVRNRLRRRLKAILDRYPLGTAPWRDIVFIARPGSGELPFAALAEEVERTLGRTS